MFQSTLAALRFSRTWLTGASGATLREIRIEVEGEAVPATLLLPGRRPRELPGWVVLHGVTRPGREHPELVRFAEALAATPAVVLIPEIREWTELRLAPGRALPIIRAGVLALDEREETAPGRTGLAAFSFGAPQAVIAAAHPSLAGHLAALVGFGSYADLDRIVRFEFTGRHEWEGVEYHDEPDPYGRWILGANYLSSIPRFADARDVAEALGRLADIAGERRVAASDPQYDEVKSELRGGIAEERRPLFDLFAPPAGSLPDPGEATIVARELASAIREDSPLAEVVPHLPKVGVPVHLVHGRDDLLIPFTETLRLRAAFPPKARAEATITGLFAHAKGSRVASRLSQIRESIAFFLLLRRLLGII